MSTLSEVPTIVDVEGQNCMAKIGKFLAEVAAATIDFPTLKLPLLIDGQGLVDHVLLLSKLTLLLVLNALHQLQANRFVDCSWVFIIVHVLTVTSTMSSSSA